MEFEALLSQVLENYPELIQYAPFIGAGIFFVFVLAVYFYIQRVMVKTKPKTGFDRVLDKLQQGPMPIPIEDLVFRGIDDSEVEEKLDVLKNRIDGIPVGAGVARGRDGEVRAKLKKELREELVKTREKVKEIRVVDHQLNIELQAIKDKIQVIDKEKENLKLDLIQASDKLNKLGEGNGKVEMNMVEKIKANLDDVSAKLAQLSKLELNENDKMERLVKELKENRIRRDKSLDELLVSFIARLERSAIEVKVKWAKVERDMQRRLKEIEDEVKELGEEGSALSKTQGSRREEKIGGMGKVEKRMEDISKNIAKLQIEGEEIREKVGGVRSDIRKVTSLNFRGKSKETRVQELFSIF